MWLTEKTGAAEHFPKQIWALCQSSYAHGSPWTYAQFVQDYQEATSRYLIMTNPRQNLIGFISFRAVGAEAEIFHVVIDPQEKRKGYSKQMLRAFFDLCQQEEITNVFLEVRKQNQPAIQLYSQMGFVSIASRKAYYHHPTEDGIVMKANVKEGIT